MGFHEDCVGEPTATQHIRDPCGVTHTYCTHLYGHKKIVESLMLLITIDKQNMFFLPSFFFFFFFWAMNAYCTLDKRHHS